MTRSRLIGIGLVAMIVLPAAILAVIGYRSFDSELRAQQAERRQRVRMAFDRVYEGVRDLLADLDARESDRAFWDYRALPIDRDAVTGEPVRRRGPLAGLPEPSFLRGWFEVDPASGRIDSPARPDPEESATLDENRAIALDRFLHEVARELGREPVRPPLPAGRGASRTHDRQRVLWNLALRRDGQNRDDTAQKAAVVDTPAPVTMAVQYGPFAYRAAPPGVAVLARRVVRFAEGDRSLLQGFVIDVEEFRRRAFPPLAARAGDADVVVRLIDTPPSAFLDPPNRTLDPVLPGLSLLAEARDPDAAVRAVEASRERFLLLLLALFAVIGGGLWLLRRTVAAEIVLARRRSDFVSAVSHELRTPLTGIRMYADMLRDGWVEDPEKVREYHESMARESERLSRLVQNVLDFSALEKGRKDFKIETGDLVEPVRSALDLLEPYLAEKGFRAVADLPDDLPEVPRDADAVQQCVVNLVDNAVKYAKGHEPREIRVTLAATDGGVELAVRDHGPGVPDDEQQSVFAAFFRGGASRSSEVGGAGLGLALVRRFARAHGGRAVVATAPGGGALFRIVFPTA